MKIQYTRAEITDLLLKHSYKPTVMKDVSDHFDVYIKPGKPRVQLSINKKVFQKSELLIILPKEVQSSL